MNLTELIKQSVELQNEITNQRKKLRKKIERKLNVFDEVSIVHDPCALLIETIETNEHNLLHEIMLLRITKDGMKFNLISEKVANEIKQMYVDAYFIDG